jgi:DNA relaxase NicK
MNHNTNSDSESQDIYSRIKADSLRREKQFNHEQLILAHQLRKGYAIPLTGSMPPSYNMGAKQTKPLKPHRYTLVDGVRLTSPNPINPRIFRRLSKYFNVEFFETGHGIKFYQKLFEAPFGISVACDRRTGKDGEVVPGVMVEFKGEALSRLSPKNQRRLLIWFKLSGFKATRFDLAFDDYTQIITPGLVRLAHLSGNVRGFRKEDATAHSTDFVNGKTYETYCLGARGKHGSGKYLRVYDAGLKHPGTGDFVRAELELSDERANQAFDNLTDLPLAHWSDYIMSVISGAVSFVDSSVSCKTSRCPLLPWWEDIVKDFGRIALASVRKSIKKFDRLRQWFTKNNASMFAVICDVISEGSGGDPDALQAFWYQLWMTGNEKYKHRHRLLVAEGISG